MILSTILLVLCALRYATALNVNTLDTSNSTAAAEKACKLIKTQFPDLVSFPGESQFNDAIDHWAISSEQTSACSVEPSNSNDISEIIKIIGRSDVRSPFAIKSGGHAFVQNFSSTPGVQISMSKFNNFIFNKEQSTVTVGVALTWDQVYEKGDPLNITVAGGRIKGVGVGGLSLGGGYSWRTDQFGLTIDNIVAHNLVLPNGNQVLVTNESNPDLFFALRGSLNNFGIVTDITYKAIPQGEIFGGTILYPTSSLDQVNEAVSDFNFQNTDPRAQIMLAQNVANGTLLPTVYLSFNSPDSSDIFNSFLSIPYTQADVRSRTVSDLTNLIGTLNPEFSPFGFTGHSVPVLKYTSSFNNKSAQLAMASEARLREQFPSLDLIVSVFLEPFLNPNAHSLGGAYPHTPERPLTPISPEITYFNDPNLTLEEKTSLYNVFAAEIKSLSTALQAEAVSEGFSRWDDILYSNYVLADTPLELLFGDNLPRLRGLAAKFDPERVMTLTGGFLLQS